MKKFFVVSVLFVLFTFTACESNEFDPTNQLAENGKIASVCGEQVRVDVNGDVFEFEGTNYHVGEDVVVFFDVNGEPTNPWVWCVIDCKPLR